MESLCGLGRYDGGGQGNEKNINFNEKIIPIGLLL
jgi:hypothetical protein